MTILSLFHSIILSFFHYFLGAKVRKTIHIYGNMNYELNLIMN